MEIRHDNSFSWWSQLEFFFQIQYRPFHRYLISQIKVLSKWNSRCKTKWFYGIVRRNILHHLDFSWFHASSLTYFRDPDLWLMSELSLNPHNWCLTIDSRSFSSPWSLPMINTRPANSSMQLHTWLISIVLPRLPPIFSFYQPMNRDSFLPDLYKLWLKQTVEMRDT